MLPYRLRSATLFMGISFNYKVYKFNLTHQDSFGIAMSIKSYTSYQAADIHIVIAGQLAVLEILEHFKLTD